MNESILITILGAVFAAGAFLDKVAVRAFKERVADILLSANRRTFTTYVAGTSLAVYASVFAHNAASWRFLVRSVLLTLTFAALGLAFIRVYFPSTFFIATSSLRMEGFSTTTVLVVLPPLIVILLSDYLSNAQTKFFLSLMASSPSLSRFLTLGYADLVATASISIIGLSLAYCIFLFGAYQTSTADIKVILDFSKSEYFVDEKSKTEIGMPPLAVVPGERELPAEMAIPPRAGGVAQNDDAVPALRRVPALSVTIVQSEIDEALDAQDDRRIQAYPWLGGGYYLEAYRRDRDRTVRLVNPRGVVETFMTTAVLEEIRVVGGLNELNAQERCKELAHAIRDPHARFEVLQGWNPVRILEHCQKRERAELQLKLRVRDQEFRYRFATTEFAGALITLTLRSLTDGFKNYLFTGFTEPLLQSSNWSWNYMVGDNKPLIEGMQTVFSAAWAMRHGHYRGLERNGYPWSTFYVAGLLTSLFIWIVIVFTAVLFPLVWVLERVAHQRTVIRIREFPFSVLAIVVSLLVTVIYVVSL